MEKPSGESTIIRLDEASSTNTELKLMQSNNPLPEWSMVMTEFQTTGRGQAGNSWYSEKSKNLLLSIVLYPYSVKAKDQFIISQVVSLALKEVLDCYTSDITIKWPNDIYWKNKKIAGILIENSLMGQHINYTIVGIGLNLNEIKFPSSLPNPVSLRQIVGSEIDREMLLSKLRYEFAKLYELMERGEIALIKQAYMQSLYRRDGQHRFVDKDGCFVATIKAVLPAGHLVLTAYPDRDERVYAFKEVAFEVDDD